VSRTRHSWRAAFRLLLAPKAPPGARPTAAAPGSSRAPGCARPFRPASAWVRMVIAGGQLLGPSQRAPHQTHPGSPDPRPSCTTNRAGAALRWAPSINHHPIGDWIFALTPPKKRCGRWKRAASNTEERWRVPTRSRTRSAPTSGASLNGSKQRQLLSFSVAHDGSTAENDADLRCGPIGVMQRNWCSCQTHVGLSNHQDPEGSRR